MPARAGVEERTISAATEELSTASHDDAPNDRPRARGLKGITGGAPFVPLAVLFGLNLVDEFDRVAFGALIPEIRDRFDVSDAQILTLGAITGVFTLLAALPLGVLADRLNRVRLSIGAAILWGVTSVLTGIVPSLILLYLVRLGSGLGRIINEVVHPSLLADYYPRENQPRVFGVHRAANSIGNIGGPLAGLVAVALFWQAAFWILAIPTAVFIVLAVLRLREPKRGESIDAELAAETDESEVATPFAEARRQLFAVKTLRRLWLGAFFLGIGALQIGNILGIFFDRVYGVGPFGRGMVQFLFGAGNVLGLVIGSRLAGRASDNGRLNRLAVITGLSFVQFAAGLVLLGAIKSGRGRVRVGLRALDRRRRLPAGLLRPRRARVPAPDPVAVLRLGDPHLWPRGARLRPPLRRRRRGLGHPPTASW